MSSALDVHVLTLPLGAYLGATEIPLAFLDADGGGITVLSAHLVSHAAGTVIGGKVVTMSNAGTPAINGTVGSFAGTVVTAAGVVAALTISTAYVAGGTWLGFDQTSGTVLAGAFISVCYVMGK
jgi:hypothetical protein